MLHKDKTFLWEFIKFSGSFKKQKCIFAQKTFYFSRKDQQHILKILDIGFHLIISLINFG